MAAEAKIYVKYGSLRTKDTIRRVLWLVQNFSEVCNERKNIRSDVFSVSHFPCLFYIAMTADANTFTIYVNRCINKTLTYKTCDSTAKIVLSFEDLFNNLQFSKELYMTKDTTCITCTYDQSKVHDILIKGNLQIVCCVSVEESKVADMQGYFKEVKNKMWSHCSAFPANELKEHIEILLDGDTSNKVIITVDGEDFSVHKSLLCSYSPVFTAMFSHETLENQQNRVFISDIHKDVIGEILKYIYTGCTSDLSPYMNIELYIAADKYAILNLKERCSKFLAASLNQKLVLDLLVLSHQYNDMELKNTAIQFLIDKAPSLLQSEDFLLFIENESKIVQSILLALVKQVMK